MEGKQPKTSSQFEIRTFSKDIIIYSAGTGLVFLFGLIQAFIVPKYLSLEGYAYWQLFGLYASYVGILHLGFVDGILIRWAGKELVEFGDEMRIAFRFLIFEQVVIILPLSLLISLLLRPPLQWIGLMVLSFAFIVNLLTFFRFTAQAIKKFTLLTIVNVGMGLILLILIILLFVSGCLNYHYVIIANLIALIVSLFALILWFRKYLWGEMPAISSLRAYGRKNIRVGIFVLLGNFVVDLFLTIDRLMISFFFIMEQFAIYAFALSAALIANTIVRAISEVFFPYLSGAVTRLRTQAYQLGKSAIIITGAAILAIYFPLVGLVEFYLPHYVNSLPMMQILLCSVGLNSLIQILHTNYYKVYGRQREYFTWAVTSLVISVILNLLAIHFWGTLASVAIATVVSIMIWYIANEIKLKQTVEQTNQQIGKGIGVTLCYLGAFWLSPFLIDGLIAQMFTYIAFFLILTWLFFHHEIKELVVLANEVRSQRG